LAFKLCKVFNEASSQPQHAAPTKPIKVETFRPPFFL
jgi:hypothetical protein